MIMMAQDDCWSLFCKQNLNSVKNKEKDLFTWFGYISVMYLNLYVLTNWNIWLL